MNSAATLNLVPGLSQHDGQWLLWAAEAMLKGALEAEMEVSVIAGPRSGGAFAPVFDLARLPAVADLLRQHSLRLVSTPGAARAVTLASYAARSGRAGFALIPNDELDGSMSSLSKAMGEPLDRGGAICVVLEDSPRQSPASCPRRASHRLNLPCIEPSSVGQLRDAMEHALRLSRAGRCPAGIVVHSSILRSSDTLELRPNRVLGSVEAALIRRKKPRTLRWTDSGGPLRVARRLELNPFQAMPSPGERVGVGFITVGPAHGTLLHIINVLGLHGRVPVLQLGLIHPMDESAVGRLLDRCQQVIVLEPRPGAVAGNVLAVAEAARKQTDRATSVASIWGPTIPPDASGIEHATTSEDDFHPSVLVRKIAHLLHSIRPTVHVAAQLVAAPPALSVAVPGRDVQIGPGAALSVIRRIVTDVDQWLRERAPLEERGVEPTALAIDGAETAGVTGRIVHVETWDHRRFQTEGIAALVHAAREDRPWIIIACESASEDLRDLERLARGAVPAERADRVNLQIANLSDKVELRDMLREASLVERLSVIIVRDGPPPHYDVAAIEQSLADIDRLGFEPRQRLVRSIDELCALREVAADQEQEPIFEHDASSMKTELTIDQVSKRVGSGLRLRVRPLVEEVEVVRTRPPVRSWQSASTGRVPTPQPVHGRQSQWRAHLAGFRHDAPGVAALALAEAGRVMGYHVRTIHDATPISAGRRAWAQVLFTHPRSGEAAPEIVATIPYGEADLLLGLDPAELLRSIGPDALLRVAFADRTHVVANVGQFGDDLSLNQPAIARSHISAAVTGVSKSESRLLDDFAAACRAWFHTDRVADVAILGAAFQLGLIPVSPEAIEAGITLVEARGFGRSRESFEFGRRLAFDVRLFSRPRDDHHEDTGHIARRMVLSLSRGGWGSGKKARSLSRLIHESLLIMPGLTDPDGGSAPQRDFITGCQRCLTWASLEYAKQYSEIIANLYRADQSSRGFMLTRHAVLPLAEAMLIRDPLYIAAMATSAEQRQRTRQRLNVKLARGDRIERRYLTRFELIGFSRRLRADVRTSDWAARVAAFVRRFAPHSWRGTKRERDLRQYIIEFMQRAIDGAGLNYARWAEAMQRLHNQAAENRLRGMALSEVRMLLESGAPQASDLAHDDIDVLPESSTSRDEAAVGS
ncbi:MAG: hypothetical protein L0Y44_00865 [Phycisphaerales bacterium]|nr:hypothetical protein [Phycisphaerales bacterium]MCI0677264.1 hypothetical protein [Phycisphaerales bacterium]